MSNPIPDQGAVPDEPNFSGLPGGASRTTDQPVGRHGVTAPDEETTLEAPADRDGHDEPSGAPERAASNDPGAADGGPVGADDPEAPELDPREESDVDQAPDGLETPEPPD